MLTFLASYYLVGVAFEVFILLNPHTGLMVRQRLSREGVILRAAVLVAIPALWPLAFVGSDGLEEMRRRIYERIREAEERRRAKDEDEGED